jgi:HAD superfamily hydrolase (TIGR01509 family)
MGLRRHTAIISASKTSSLAQRIAKRTQFDARDIGHLISSIPPHLIPIEGTVRLIEKLKQAGHRLYFLSNMPRPYAEYLTRTNAFFEHFDDGIFSADVHEIKPNQSTFKYAQNRWDLKNDTIFIDDVKRNIDAAIKFGWRCIQFTKPHALENELIKLKYF